MSPKSIRALTIILALFVASAASAQDIDATVTVLDFGTSGNVGDSGSDFYNELRTQVELHRDMMLNDVPAQSLDDLLFAVGCGELDSDCAYLVGDVLGTDLLAYGNLTLVSDTQYSIRLTLYDLVLGQEVRVRTHVFVGSQEMLNQLMPVFARSLLYEAGAVMAFHSTPAGAEVYVNDELVGTAPVETEELPIGLYTVRMESEGHSTREETVIADLGTTEEDWTLAATEVADSGRRGRGDDEDATPPVTDDPGVSDTVGSDGSGAAAIVPWTLIGVGGAFVVLGTVEAILMAGTQSDFDDEVARVDWNPEQAQDLRDKGRRQATLANVFWGIGGLSLASGIVLMMTQRGLEQDTASRPLIGNDRFALEPNLGPRGGGVTFSGTW